MSGMAVVYEVEDPAAAHAGGAGGAGGEAAVVRVHAAPAAPGMPGVPGPRTYCGRDTFAMRAAPRTPAERPGPTWYEDGYADRVCPACDEAVGTG
ncbi:MULTISPECIES: hypothetical protein [unclassified Streptomyces]|uniref:hypothetical protein n=1 Tax=unclassified Streptomyces TaxID=2593676 RepID=UPI000449C5E6|nr:hypothetical protein [Streptomyces sp. PCS3-D2]WKV75297.1 hypothetical protein AW27_029500 [Streptomyces sp. PCS3-D2]